MLDMLKTGLKHGVQLLSSLGLAVVLFSFLLLLTYLGTLYQVEHGLYAAQKRYFESLFLIHHAWGRFPVPLPGGYLVMTLLFVNLLLGGLFRMRKGWNQAGILVAHAGILLLLLGGFITYKYSLSGHMTLYENERSNVFKSYHEWELAIARVEPDGTRTEFIIPQEQFEHLEGHRTEVFRAADLPFDVTLGHYLRNTLPQPARAAQVTTAAAVDGFFLQELPPEREHERNAAGLYAILDDKESGARHDVLLWGLQTKPAEVELNGSRWLLDLRRKQWQVPFTIVLDKFNRELHPRTNMPKAFASDVTKIEGGTEERINISMNQPLRHRGYTFFQASWGPSDAGPNDPLFSSFAVVRNPADQVPLYACIVTTLGLLMHFSIRLRKYLAREQKRAT